MDDPPKAHRCVQAGKMPAFPGGTPALPVVSRRSQAKPRQHCLDPHPAISINGMVSDSGRNDHRTTTRRLSGIL